MFLSLSHQKNEYQDFVPRAEVGIILKKYFGFNNWNEMDFFQTNRFALSTF